ncbi:hypothetical protein CASFOL_030260 [Castilleja foliolosa]|uniref:Uncharacterized protein n=1 Tax=Castilleja foliolosa TaxID=1961234 RepID=A0ABD3C7H0_9LAMI
MIGGSKMNTAAREKSFVTSKKIKLSSSQIEADNLAAAGSGEAGPSVIPTVPEPDARVDEAASGAAVPDLEPDKETHLGSVKVKDNELESDEDEEESSDDVDDENHSSLVSRNGAYQIVKAMKVMNATQRNEVSDLGLGLLLQLNAPKELPTNMY